MSASVDPAGGAYAVEELTDALASVAWEEVRRIESAGGFDAALADGSLTRRIAQTAADRAQQIRTRRRPITGVSEFPLTDEVVPERIPWEHPDPVLAWAGEFEALRDGALDAPVLLATMGSVAQHTARAGFAANCCAAGGIPTVSAGATSGADEVAAALRATGASVAILAGTDEQYAQAGATHIAALRAAGAAWVVLAGKPTDELADLVDDHLAVGVDVVSACERLRARVEGVEA